MSMRLEAPITITLSSALHAVELGEELRHDRGLHVGLETPVPRVRSSESISSMNTMTGLPSAARSRARVKI